MTARTFTPRNFELERLLEELTAKVDRIERALTVGRSLHRSQSWLHRFIWAGTAAVQGHCPLCTSIAYKVADEAVDERTQWFHRRASQLIEGIKQHHRPSGNRERGELFGHCITCMTAWPCPTARLVQPDDELLLRETVR